MKAVFDTKPTSIYDDDLTTRYQFPHRYLGLVQQCLGDWVVLRRSRADGGDLAYVAIAKVAEIVPDPNTDGLSYAHLDGFLPFDDPVPWRVHGRYAEAALRALPVPQVGVYLRGRSVRALAEEDFADLVKRGTSRTLAPENAERLALPAHLIEAASQAIEITHAVERTWRIEEILTNRIIREASFSRAVYEAYDNQCAVTRFRMFDRRGNSEVHAAHIWAVSLGGPDVVQNGIALSATVHWLFDRFLISLTDDHKLLISDRVPTGFLSLIEGFGNKIALPADPNEWPHPVYLAKHRELFVAANKI